MIFFKYIIDFSANGTFPSKSIWKKLVICNIQITEQSSWSERISNDSDFNFFKLIHSVIKVHRAWAVAILFPELRVAAKYVIDLCAIVRIENEKLLYDKCGMF